MNYRKQLNTLEECKYIFEETALICTEIIKQIKEKTKKPLYNVGPIYDEKIGSCGFFINLDTIVIYKEGLYSVRLLGTSAYHQDLVTITEAVIDFYKHFDDLIRALESYFEIKFEITEP